MDRRKFVTALFCIGGSAVALTSAPAEAMTLLTPQLEPMLQDIPVAAIATDEDLASTQIENVYYRRRRIYRRRYYYRPVYRYRRRRSCRLFRDYYGRLFRRCY